MDGKPRTAIGALGDPGIDAVPLPEQESSPLVVAGREELLETRVLQKRVLVSEQVVSLDDANQDSPTILAISPLLATGGCDGRG